MDGIWSVLVLVLLVVFVMLGTAVGGVAAAVDQVVPRRSFDALVGAREVVELRKGAAEIAPNEEARSR
ncbi:hypothetical protein DQ384_35735 [Sphaerisporangium album]|uniref:Uncharacterized protein n=1 Tax=Sphaerisporangium album TaxID=509200 RepID=A0A367EYJ0_9ACTN|nr:hypothetical protein [Sphaerisporangium album]RCG22457.1 hypothetical protein DQ384_35735 [Sphaerisporangium album]